MECDRPHQNSRRERPGARKADSALPHLWRVPASAGPFDADSRLDAAKNHRCDHCGRSRDYCRPAGVCPCSRKNAAAHTGILQKEAWKALELRRAVDWEKLKTAIRFEDAGITICAEENEEHLPYTRIKSAFESLHLWLVVCDDECALLLQKKDLRSGNADSFLSDIISKMNTGTDASG